MVHSDDDIERERRIMLALLAETDAHASGAANTHASSVADDASSLMDVSSNADTAGSAGTPSTRRKHKQKCTPRNMEEWMHSVRLHHPPQYPTGGASNGPLPPGVKFTDEYISGKSIV